ncbi:unnamed protein product [Nippostrongylus brasiliensis]|uniref:DUF4005 domain-containing protein n=1 Tax=Nippostrongylus brasiliensis TaxID=27835 RepID=A0A0N4Y5X1_NIPBR|nr:unnamed protein product [Nippostrongylus brasiliensis]
MDWEPSVEKISAASKPPSSAMRPSEVMARMVREATPSRELAPSLSSLSLFSDDQPNKSPHPNVFAGSAARRAPSESYMQERNMRAPSIAHSQFSVRV